MLSGGKYIQKLTIWYILQIYNEPWILIKGTRYNETHYRHEANIQQLTIWYIFAEACLKVAPYLNMEYFTGMKVKYKVGKTPLKNWKVH